MNALELLTMPGMSAGTRRLERMRADSQSRLQAAARQQQMANALMAARSRKTKQS